MKSNVDAIYAEYPFLKNLVPRLSVMHAKVSRFDEDLFDLPTVRWSDFADAVVKFRILLLDQQGNLVARVGQGRWFKSMTRQETVGQALVRIGELAQKVHYVLVADSDPMLFCRLPREVPNAAVWLEKRIEEGLAELRSQ